MENTIKSAIRNIAAAAASKNMPAAAASKNMPASAASKNMLAAAALFGLMACYQAGASVSRDYVSVFQKRAKTSKSGSAAHLQKQLRKDIARLASLFSGGDAGDEVKISPALEIKQAVEIKAKAKNLAKDINSRRFDFAAQKDFLLEKAKKLKPRLPSKQTASKQIARRNGQAQKGDFGAFRLSQRRIQ